MLHLQMLTTGEAADSGIGMLMNLRKCANHPLLIRDHYDQHKLEVGFILVILQTLFSSLTLGDGKTFEDQRLWTQAGGGELYCG